MTNRKMGRIDPVKSDMGLGSGFMAERIQKFDWNATRLGPLENWPQSLKTAVSICINSRFPMFVWWGPELLNIYNDAYIPVLGKRHPNALGKPAQEIWDEIWPDVGPQADAVMLRGEATWNESVQLVMERNGFPEDVWFTWSYSPIPDETGQIAGLFCACTEDTKKVLAERENARIQEELAGAEQRFRTMADTAPAMLWVTDPDGSCTFLSRGWYDYTGQTEAQAVGFGWLDAVHPDDLKQSKDIFLKANSNQEAFSLHYRIRKADGTYRWAIDAGQPHFSENGSYLGFIGSVIDISELKEAEEQERFLIELDNVLRPLTDPTEMTLTAATFLGKHLNVDRCAYAEVEENQDTMNLTGNYLRSAEIKDITGQLHFSDFGEEVLQLMRENQPYVVHDIDTHTPPVNDPSSYKATQIQAVICVPLHKGPRLVAAMAVHSRSPRRWTQDEVELVQLVAARCWESIERTRIERDLRESEEKFRMLADSIPQLAWMTDETGYIFWYNKRWYDYTGTSFEDMKGWGWETVHDPAELPRVLEKFRNALTKGEPWEDTFPLRRHDGEMRWHLSRALPVRNQEGKIVRWFGTNTDIADQLEAKEKAEAANRAKTEFLANMSHEIRTPMNAIIGLAQILNISGPLTEKQKEYVKTLQLSADSLLSLINDLLDISKIEARTVELEKTPFNLSQLVKEIIEITSLQTKQKNLEFVMDGNLNENMVFIGDPMRLRQIFMNLCSNAIKFTDKGRIVVSINDQSTDKKNMRLITFEIRDTGIGISADKLDTIFQKFVQADSSINRKYGGTGLGLAITKTLIEVMGGEIKVESEIGKGSTFCVSLPLMLSPTQIPVNDRGLINSHVKKSITPHQGHLLLVEDHEANVLVAGTFLEDFGYTYDVANNGLQAIEKVQNGKYWAVLMDVQMPEMNGYEATRFIRNLEQQKHLESVPIIGMTANALKGDRELCLEAGMNDYICKPFNSNELKTILQKYVSKSFREQEVKAT